MKLYKYLLNRCSSDYADLIFLLIKPKNCVRIMLSDELNKQV